MQVVIFKLKDEEFGVETSKVQNIGDNMSITRVPKSPSFIKGLVNLRGNVITLLDINLLLGIDNDNESKIKKEIKNIDHIKNPRSDKSKKFLDLIKK